MKIYVLLACLGILCLGGGANAEPAGAAGEKAVSEQRTKEAQAAAEAGRRHAEALIAEQRAAAAKADQIAAEQRRVQEAVEETRKQYLQRQAGQRKDGPREGG